MARKLVRMGHRQRRRVRQPRRQRDHAGDRRPRRRKADQLTARIFHIALDADWQAAQGAGEYRISTLGRTLEEEGFIHCSASPEQGSLVLTSFYAGVHESLVLLTIAPELVPAEIHHETPPGATEAFPHIYGPLPIAAVTRAVAIPRDKGGFHWPHDPTATD